MGKEDRIRRLIAREAARLMYEEGVKEYRDAKRKAAKAFGSGKPFSIGSYLPSNADIHGEMVRLIAMFEGELQPERLLHLRRLALKQMELLAPFHPYLVGSVLTGSVTERSDIDLHLFADGADEVEAHLAGEGVPFEMEVVTVRRGGEFLEYPHIYLEAAGVVVECTVYPREDIHRVPRSSITGRPMERADEKKLKRIIAQTVGDDATSGR